MFLVMTTSTPEKQDGLKALNDAIEVIKEKINTLGGVFAIQMAVRIKITFSLKLHFLKQKFDSRD